MLTDVSVENSNATPTRAELRDRARNIATLIEEDAVRIEEGARITHAVFEALVDARLFWMSLPQELGGADADIRTCIEVIEEISRADGSTGWSFMAAMMTTGFIGGFASDEAVNTLFSGPEQPIIVGQLTPVGKAARGTDGYLCSGQHSFGSGSDFANWIGAGQVIHSGTERQLRPDGSFETCIALLPRADVSLRGNWDVMGLAGTASFDYEVRGKLVPPHMVIDGAVLMPDGGRWVRRGPAMNRMGMVGAGVSGHAAVVLGIAKRALQEVIGITRKKARPGYPSVIADDPVFRNQFTLQEAKYQAARAFVLDVFGAGEKAAERSGALPSEHYARARQAVTWVHDIALEIVSFCFGWAGSAAFRNPSVLGRCMRDMLVAKQHMLVDPKSLTDAAARIIEVWEREGV